MDGVLKVLGLANVVELGLIIYSKSYKSGGVDEVEHLQFVAARLSARRLIAWMDQRLTLISRYDNSEISVRDAHHLWLAEQTGSLCEHVKQRRTEFEAAVPEGFDTFNKLMDEFTSGWGGHEFKEMFDISDRISYEYPGVSFNVRDNMEADSVYGK